jgi:hypothetical protein
MLAIVPHDCFKYKETTYFWQIQMDKEEFGVIIFGFVT